MSRLNYLVRDLISFVGFPCRTTTTLVRGRVFSMFYRSNKSFGLPIWQHQILCQIFGTALKHTHSSVP